MPNRTKKTRSKNVVYKNWKPTHLTGPQLSPLVVDLRRRVPTNYKFLLENTAILKRWTTTNHLGNFGSHILKAYDSKLKTNVAIKACISETTTLDKEHYILKKLQHLRCTPQPIYCHLHPDSKPNLKFLVMTFHGPDTETLLKKYGTFSLPTVTLIGMQMLQAIEYLHCFGYIHRDIKPSHFLTCLPPNNQRILLVDFSSSRSFVTKYRRHCVQRRKPGFRGSLKYASPNAHNEQDLSRRDDLWSLLISMLSYRTKLPWEREIDHGSLAYQKLEKTEGLVRKYLSTTFTSFGQHISSLQFYDEPDYDLLKMSFFRTIRMYGVSKTQLYDWDKVQPSDKIKEHVKKIETI